MFWLLIFAHQINIAEVGCVPRTIAEMVEQFNAHATEVVAKIQQEKDDKPKVTKVTTKRVNGKLETDQIIYEDETKH